MTNNSHEHHVAFGRKVDGLELCRRVLEKHGGERGSMVTLKEDKGAEEAMDEDGPK